MGSLTYFTGLTCRDASASKTEVFGEVFGEVFSEVFMVFIEVFS